MPPDDSLPPKKTRPATPTPALAPAPAPTNAFVAKRPSILPPPPNSTRSPSIASYRPPAPSSHSYAPASASGGIAEPTPRGSVRPPSLRPPSNRPPNRPPSIAPPPNSARPKPLSPTSLRLSSTDFGLVAAARHVVEGALALVPGDRLVVVHDEARTPLAQAIIGAGEDLGAHVESLVLEAIEPRPVRVLPDVIRLALTHAEAAILVIGVDDGEGGLALELAAQASLLGLRYGEMIGAGRSGMIAGFSVERSRIADAVRALRARLRPGGVLRLRSPAGSDLEVHLPLDVRWTEHNAPVRIGRAEPLPAASVSSYVARIRGTFVADASCGSALGAATGSLASSPVRLEIDGGICRSIRCKDGALERSLDALVRSEPLLQRIGAIHFGAHVGLLDATGEIGCDLTLPGLHLSLGTRTSQDGAPFTTRSEIGFAGRASDVDVDGVPLVRAGRVLSP